MWFRTVTPGLFAAVRRTAAFALAAGACMGAAAFAAELETSREYIVGFVRYVHWNDEAGVAAWTVCVVEPATPGATGYAEESVRGKAFVVRRIADTDPIAGCHVLDLTGAAADASDRMLQRTRGQPILSVGSGPAFCSAGGLICLRGDGGAQKFEVNLSAVKASGLTVSSRLLMLGTDRAPKQVRP